MKKPVRMLKSQAGFSLIELMIVVAIIGILASIAVPNFQKFQRRAKQSEGKGYLSGIYTAEGGFRAEWNTYITDLRCAGFKDMTITTATSDGIAGKGNYIAGFATDAIPTVAGNAGCTAGGNTAHPVFSAGTLTTVTPPATAIMSAPNAYIAGSTGDISSGAVAPDAWTIDQDKAITNTVSGI